jgi:hypothetical protein
MKRRSIAMIGVLFAAPAFAQTGDAPPRVAKAALTCRTSVVTGSRMPKHMCHTAKEWADIDLGRRRDVDRGNIALTTISKAQNDPVGTPNFQ